FRSVISQHPEWRLHIIGGGPDRAFLESMSAQLGLKSSQVVFEGLQPNHIVYQRIRECSFLIMNSRFETFSSVCTEALCCGKPVIATRCGGPQEYIGPEQGVLITPDNQQELIDGINWMVEHHMKFIPEDLAQYADKKFGYESIGQRFSRWYQAVLHPQVRPVD
ncbi:MAG: glycosyltransferase, partial [Flavobacteriales bacterium]